MGFHPTIFVCLGADTDVVKPYTPVDETLMSQSSAEIGSYIHLMIKVYPDGVLTPHIANLHIGNYSR